jgi:hypothetical protein
VTSDGEPVEGEAKWNEETYCAAWKPSSISTWPIGGKITVFVNPKAIECDGRFMRDCDSGYTKIYTCTTEDEDAKKLSDCKVTAE